MVLRFPRALQSCSSPGRSPLPRPRGSTRGFCYLRRPPATFIPCLITLISCSVQGTPPTGPRGEAFPANTPPCHRTPGRGQQVRARGDIPGARVSPGSSRDRRWWHQALTLLSTKKRLCAVRHPGACVQRYINGFHGAFSQTT